MKNWLILSIVGVSLSGCAINEPTDSWQGLTTEIDPATSPLDCGNFPLPDEMTGNTLVYGVGAANDLETYRVCAEANKAIAAEHVTQIAQLKIARAGLVDAGQAQQRIAQMRLEMLEDERRHNFWQNVGQWVLIVGLAFAL